MNALGTMSAASGDDVASLAAGNRLPEHVVRSAFVC
jgi:hypothetical protein